VPRTALGTCPVDGGRKKKKKNEYEFQNPKKSSKKVIQKSHPFRHPLVLNQVVVVIHTKEHVLGRLCPL